MKHAQFEAELWGAINRYAIAVGGDPSEGVHGNAPRLQAAEDIEKLVAGVAARQQIDDIVIEDLAKSGSAAAAYAGKAGVNAKRLHAMLLNVRGFLRGSPELGLRSRIEHAPALFIVHVYNADGDLHDYYVHQTVDAAIRQAAADVVDGRFPGLGPGSNGREDAICRAIAEIDIEPGVCRRHLRCAAWHAHVDEVQVLP